jgi:arabinose-5-phosphate isomerase
VQGQSVDDRHRKAGHIARKFAATLCSTATPADFIHPAEAAHGDLGVVGKDDVMIAFSTSGKSVEVL